MKKIILSKKSAYKKWTQKNGSKLLETYGSKNFEFFIEYKKCMEKIFPKGKFKTIEVKYFAPDWPGEASKWNIDYFLFTDRKTKKTINSFYCLSKDLENSSQDLENLAKKEFIKNFNYLFFNTSDKIRTGVCMKKIKIIKIVEEKNIDIEEMRKVFRDTYNEKDNRKRVIGNISNKNFIPGYWISNWETICDFPINEKCSFCVYWYEASPFYGEIIMKKQIFHYSIKKEKKMKYSEYRQKENEEKKKKEICSLISSDEYQKIKEYIDFSKEIRIVNNPEDFIDYCWYYSYSRIVRANIDEKDVIQTSATPLYGDVQIGEKIEKEYCDGYHPSANYDEHEETKDPDFDINEIQIIHYTRTEYNEGRNGTFHNNYEKIIIYIPKGEINVNS